MLETALEAEITEHPGHERHGPAEYGYVSNGTRSKAVFTEVGPVEIDVPRGQLGAADREERQCRLDGIEKGVLSLTARGVTTGEIAAHFDDVYGATVSKDTISRITAKASEEMAEWTNRPLTATTRWSLSLTNLRGRARRRWGCCVTGTTGTT
uniref:transposase n=1 Tax=Neomicrococcus aestuarii TaxID=556325 RepID=UPI00161DE9F8|nr:transposase [Neomicrococcus aestuarii]